VGITIRSLLLASLILLSGCKATEVKEVLILGDSISVITAGDVINTGEDVNAGSPAPRILFTILATSGIGAMTKANDGTEYWGKVIPNVVYENKYDVVVVELGTNDCAVNKAKIINYGDYAPYVHNIVNAIRSQDPLVPIYWMTNPTAPPCGDVVNNDIASVVPTLPYKQWALDNSQCYYDGIHPNPSWSPTLYEAGIGPKEAPVGYCNGTEEYAKWLKAQLDNHFITL